MNKVPVRVVDIPWWNRGITWFVAGLFLLAAIYGITRPEHSKADTSKSVERIERSAPVTPPVAPPKVITETPKTVSVSVPASATVHTNNGTVNVNGGSATVGVNNGTVNVGCTFQTPPSKVERIRETLVVDRPVYVEVEKPVIVEKVVERFIEIPETPKPKPAPKAKPKPLDPCDQGQLEHEARVAKWRQFGKR